MSLRIYIKKQKKKNNQNNIEKERQIQKTYTT